MPDTGAGIICSKGREASLIIGEVLSLNDFHFHLRLTVYTKVMFNIPLPILWETSLGVS